MIGSTSIRRLLLVTAVAIGFGACAPEAQLRQDPEDFREDVARLQREIAENPDEAEPLRDLGTIYVKTKRANEGYRYLQNAFSRDPDDPKTLFYLGIASERIGKRKTAQRLYQRYPQVPDDSPYHTLMRGRYEWLLRQEIRRSLKEMMAREDTIGMSPEVVAVLPLVYQGDDERYAPLGQGLSEMITVDLANIDELTLVERTRLQALLQELQLAQTEYVDPSTAPRVGRLLGAGRLVGGGYSVLGDETLRTDITLAQLEQDDQMPNLATRSAALEELFELTTEIVYEVVDRLGIELTSQERNQIEQVPTRNLQAFLAYSRGLEAEAHGNYGAAAESFARARELDPNFSRAADKQEEMEGLAAVAGGTTQALLAAAQFESVPTRLNLVQNRLLMQSQSLGLSAPTDRQPAAESNSLEPPQVLRDPPPPPGGGSDSP